MKTFGNIDETFAGKVLRILKDCYNCIGADAVSIVDLYIFDKSSAMNAFLSEEKRNLGIGTSPFESSFFAVHDAWRGTPRIIIAYDRMLNVPELVAIGGLHHEVAHTVLHGSLESYMFSVPTLLLKLERDGVVSRQTTRDILYLVSVAVKDYEVTRLLHKRGYLEDQVAYNKHFLQPDEEDREAWDMTEENRAGRLLVLVSILKTVCCAAPLLKDGRHGAEICESIITSMRYLPKELSARLLRILQASSEFGHDTQENVDLLMNKIVDQLVTNEDCQRDT